MIIWTTEDTTFIAVITTNFMHKSLGWPWWMLPSILVITSLTRFNHENVIDIRDILRSASLDSMKDVYIVQVIMTPDQRQKPLSHKSAFLVFLANTFLPDVAFSVPDGDRSVQAAQNPAVKQRSHLLLPLPGGLCIMVMIVMYRIPCCAITHSKCWLDHCCSV